MAEEQWDSREVVTGDLRRADCSCFLSASVKRCLVARREWGRILFSLGSFHAFEFPRIVFAGNSSRCIKTAVFEGHSYYRSLPLPILGHFLASLPKQLILQALELVAVCNASRILMHDAA